MKSYPTQKQPKVRLNLDITLEAKEQIEGLRERTHSDSMSEVVRRALAVYDFLWTQKDGGATTILRFTDGSETLLPLF
jgi:Arc/MetJ-type ribon-helix-helix transcriptional regulator